MKKTKVANLVWTLGSGGIESSNVNYYSYMNHDEIEMDFIMDWYDSGRYDTVFDKYNTKCIFIFSEDEAKKRALYKIKKSFRLFRIFRENNYDVVYNNVSYPSTLMYGFIAKLAGVKKVITRADSSGPSKVSLKANISNKLYKGLFQRFSNLNIASSPSAGIWAYRKDTFIVSPHGIDVDKFLFSEVKRKEIRKKYGISNELVVGTVGRLTPVKNHSFIIDVVNSIVQSGVRNIKCIFVGEGELEEELKEYVNSLELNDYILFCGFHEDVNAYLSAMDVFLLPSLHEGFGIAAVEAQVNGLFVLASKGVPQNTKVTNKVDYIDFDVNMWKEKILSYQIKKGDREYNAISGHRYDIDIKTMAKKMESAFKG